MKRTTGALIASGALLLLTPVASAAAEVTDPCGPGTFGPGPAPANPEPARAWLDICSGEVSADHPAEPAAGVRAVRSVFELSADVAFYARAGAAYGISLRGDQCFVEARYRIYPGTGTDTATDLEGNCGSDRFRLPDSAAVAGSVSGSSVTLLFDASRLAAGDVPDALLDDLAPGGALSETWLSTADHTGVPGVFWLAGGGVVRGDLVETGPVPLH